MKTGKGETIVDVTSEKWREAKEWDWDDAMDATGYGSYNISLLLASIAPFFACLFATSTVSFILPSAECDLDLTNFDKGLLNAIPYIGMILTGFFWGFLADTLGRQKLLVIGFFLDAAFNLAAGLVQSFPALLAAKLFDGLVCGGPYSAILTYLAECNPDNKRSQIVQISGVATAIATCMLPMLAWAVLPLSVPEFSSAFSLPSWRVFLLVSAFPSLVSAVSFCFRWESPKFLHSKGRSDEALEILRQMYQINTKNPGYTFPVTALRPAKNEKAEGNEITESLKQVLTLFRAPHVSRAVLVFMVQFGALFGYNTIRLWMPQLFATILSAESRGVEGSSVCALVMSEASNATRAALCPTVVDEDVYLNSILIGVITALVFVFCGYATSRITDKTLILGAVAASVASCVLMYWGVSSTLMLLFGGIFISATSVSSTAILSVALRIFPTEVKTMAVSLTMMFGQIGGTLGNLLFPILLDWSCEVPFFALAALLLGTGLLIILVPSEEKS